MQFATAAFVGGVPLPLHGGCAANANVKRLEARPNGVVRSAPLGRRARGVSMHAQGRVKYWRGEWLCVDCGFIYKTNKRNPVMFEDLPENYKCPQCNAPKRRFAKKAGAKVQETAGTSNSSIVVFSVLGLLFIVAFGVWASIYL